MKIWFCIALACVLKGKAFQQQDPPPWMVPCCHDLQSRSAIEPIREALLDSDKRQLEALHNLKLQILAELDSRYREPLQQMNDKMNRMQRQSLLRER